MMRLIICCALLAIFSHVQAQEGSTTPSSAVEAPFKIQLVRVETRASLPADLDLEHRPFHQPAGHELTFMIEGERLARVKLDGVVVERIVTRDDQQRATSGLQPFYRLSPDIGRSIKGKYAFFRLSNEGAPIDEVAGMTLEGSVTVLVADGSETYTSETIDLKRQGTTKLGPFVFTMRGEVKPMANPFSGLTRAFGVPEQDATQLFLGLSVDGPFDSMASMEVNAGKERLSCQSSSRQGDHGDYDFRKAGDGRAIISVVAWKNLRELKLPFKCAVLSDR